MVTALLFTQVAEEGLLEWVKDGAPAGAVVITVIVFIRYLQGMQDRHQSAFQSLHENYTSSMHKLMDDHNKQTEALASQISHLSSSIVKLTARIDRMSSRAS